jgi:hypothetical protein
MIWLSQEMIETLNVRNCTGQRERFYLKSTIMLVISSLIMTKAITLLLLSVALSLILFIYVMLYILEDICNLLEQLCMCFRERGLISLSVLFVGALLSKIRPQTGLI